MSVDAVMQLLEARSGRLSDWHPPIMAFLWRGIDRMIPGPFGMLVLQSAMFWIGIFLVHKAYFSRTHANLTAAILVAVMFSPPIVGIAGGIWKDNLMLASFLMCLGVVGLLRNDERRGPRSVLLLSLLFLPVLFFGLAVRHNAVFAAVPLVALASVHVLRAVSWTAKMMSMAVGAVVCLLLFVAAGEMNAKLRDRETRPWLSVALFDIAGIIKNVPDPAEADAIWNEIPKALQGSGGVSLLRERYRPNNWLELVKGDNPALCVSYCTRDVIYYDPPLLSGFDEVSREEADRIKEIWMSSARRHIGAWLTHRTDMFTHVIGTDGGPLWHPSFLNPKGYPREVDKYYANNNEKTWLQENIEWQIRKNDGIFIFRPWFYLVITSLVAALFLFNRHTASLDVLLISASALLHEGALFFLAPSPDFRYSLYLILFAMLAAFLIAYDIVAKRGRPTPG